MVGCDFNPRWFWNNNNIKDVLNLLEGADKPIFHICNGSSGIGDIRLDRSIITARHNDKAKRYQDAYLDSCNVQGDLKHLPFKDGVAGTVLCDPPYKYDFTKPELINELVRICKPKGKIVFIAPWVPNHKAIKVINTDLWKVGNNGAYHKIRTVFYKSNGQIGDYS